MAFVRFIVRIIIDHGAQHRNSVRHKHSLEKGEPIRKGYAKTIISQQSYIVASPASIGATKAVGSANAS
jgi:hypothetical protein